MGVLLGVQEIYTLLHVAIRTPPKNLELILLLPLPTWSLGSRVEGLGVLVNPTRTVIVL